MITDAQGDGGDDCGCYEAEASADDDVDGNKDERPVAYHHVVGHDVGGIRCQAERDAVLHRSRKALFFKRRFYRQVGVCEADENEECKHGDSQGEVKRPSAYFGHRAAGGGVQRFVHAHHGRQDVPDDVDNCVHQDSRYDSDYLS